jgi:hypothetical protein
MKHNPVIVKSYLNENATDVPPSHNFPYPIIYASEFKIGSIAHAMIVLELWKDFDNNTLDKGTEVFAEQVRMDFADGTSFSGNREDFMTIMKQQRKTFSSFKSSIDAIVSLQPEGKDESWGNVWGSQTGVTTAGVTSTVLINENWMFNSNGKVSYIRQFSAVPQKAST